MSGPGCGRIEIFSVCLRSLTALTLPSLSLHVFVRALPRTASIPVVGHPDGHGALAAPDTHVSSNGGPVACNVLYLVPVARCEGSEKGGVRSNIPDYHFHGPGRSRRVSQLAMNG